MKTINIDGQSYGVKFVRNILDVSWCRGDGQRRAQTICQIHLLDRGDKCCGLMAEGTAVCNRKDQDVKKRGYKAALTKALKDSVFDKDQRRAIWMQMEELFV